MHGPEPEGPRPHAYDSGASPFAILRELAIPFEEAEERLREELQKEGFGIPAEVDVQETLKRKLDVDGRAYRILYAWDAALAYEALSVGPEVGLLLPCTVVVYEREAHGTSAVAALDPVSQLAPVGARELDRLGQELRSKIQRVLDGLE